VARHALLAETVLFAHLKEALFDIPVDARFVVAAGIPPSEELPTAGADGPLVLLPDHLTAPAYFSMRTAVPHGEATDECGAVVPMIIPDGDDGIAFPWLFRRRAKH
jgi:hypothetical protein